MSKTVLNVKTDAHIKREAQNVAKDIGVPLSTVVNAYLKEFIRTRELRVRAEPRLKPHIVKLFEEAEREPLDSVNNSPMFTTADDAIAYLNSFAQKQKTARKR